jgi:hypothetical protein
MTTLNIYDNIEIGDSIYFPNSFLLNKGGIVSAIKGLNGHAKFVYTTNGGKFAISRYNRDYTLEQVGA